MDYEEKRNRMVEEQLIPRGISASEVLEAFLRVPREHFVPSESIREAYFDYPLSIGRGQTISQPYIVALMTEQLYAKKQGKVLEIGTGSGYQAAILAEIWEKVYTVERDNALLSHAEKVLLKEGYDNIVFNWRDGTKGWEEESPFDGIIVTAASPEIPEPLKDQLADGGRLVIPVGSEYTQQLVVVERKGKEFIQKTICGCVFVPLVGEYGWEEE